jgi:hypothetical protein
MYWDGYLTQTFESKLNNVQRFEIVGLNTVGLLIIIGKHTEPSFNLALLGWDHMQRDTIIISSIVFFY